LLLRLQEEIVAALVAAALLTWLWGAYDPGNMFLGALMIIGVYEGATWLLHKILTELQHHEAHTA
jgi:hypothetical protein